jgi:hypothetical protein
MQHLPKGKVRKLKTKSVKSSFASANRISKNKYGTTLYMQSNINDGDIVPYLIYFNNFYVVYLATSSSSNEEKKNKKAGSSFYETHLDTLIEDALTN